ncbi:hypothetical protein F2Q70_00000469 [Brassica cretica]|uniref:Uncharacterized protein n=1 Tax=Brassica cretica TaxID=69181 RepID=A0A8S9ILZ8_BRACR|nr:hypothetical protein F2Q70_00000469 [Brassica cretica]
MSKEVRERRIQNRAKDAELLRGQSKRHGQGRECEHEIEKIRSLVKVPQAISRVETEGGKSCVTELTGGRGVIGDAVRERRIQNRAKDAELLRGQSKRHGQGRECEHEIEKIRSLVVMENPPPRH